MVATRAEGGETIPADRLVTSAYVRPGDIVIAITTAVVVHALVFFALVVIAVRSIAAAAQAQPAPADQYVVIRPEMFQRTPAPAVEAPAEEPGEEPPPDQFVRTLAAQASPEEARDTPLIGEHNTKAAGDLPPDPDAPRMPSIAGLDERDRKDISTFESDFEDADDPAPVPLAKPAPAPASRPQPTAAEPRAMEENQELQEPKEAREQGEVLEELRQTDTVVPIPVQEGEHEEEMEEQLPKEKKAQAEPQSANTPGGDPSPPTEATPAPPRDPRYQGEVRKRRLRGSIGRDGPVAPEVRNTPLGRYQAELSRAVEREWQRNCIRYRNHITPGILTIRFLVDDLGEVSGIRFLDVVEAGEIQKGFTLNSLKHASIPIMPKELKDDLDGEPLELIYNFYF